MLPNLTAQTKRFSHEEGMSISASGISSLKQQAARHRLFSILSTPPMIRKFMSYQVWCVWDFMVLVKSIQRDLQGPSSVWLPSPNPLALRLINAILAEEETDHIDGFVGSHYELFLTAMEEAGVPRAPSDTFCRALNAGVDPIVAMQQAGAPKCAQTFVANTIALSKVPLAGRAAALYHSREDLVPDMLVNLLGAPMGGDPGLDGLKKYIERHIFLDEGMHASLSQQLYNALTPAADAPEALEIAAQAVRARIRYFDEIAQELET